MSTAAVLALAGALLALGSARAQAPTGTIAGAVKDPSGAVVADARVMITRRTTGGSRTLVVQQGGDFSIPALPAGMYDVCAEAPGFQRLLREALVETGSTTTVDLVMRVGDILESVTVDGASPQMQYEDYRVAGVTTRERIEGLPLNGRSFLELAKLEPGVQPPTRGSNNRTFVPVLGAPMGNNGRGTRVTVDGGSIMALGNGGSAMGFSQEVVQEFQTSTLNFDLSTGLTFAGAVNVVTRSGGNDLHGTAFYFFRDHQLAAYPALNRDPSNPDPLFQRRQFGFALGGPIRHNKVFFFGTWERNEQREVFNTTLHARDFASLSRITPSALFGNELSLRLDAQLSEAHTAFLRYSHDGNRAFSPSTLTGAGPNAYPSNWTRQELWADQALLGVTSVFHPTLVHDLRFSYFFVSSNELPPQEHDCPGCLGVGAPMISVAQAGLVIGNSAASFNLGRRLHFSDALVWQRGTHRARFGMDWEHNRGGRLDFLNEPVTMVLFSPDEVRQYNRQPQTPAELRVALPASFRTLDDILQLPLQNLMLGIGDPRVPQPNGSKTRTWNTVRLFFHDTWQPRRGLTISYGLAWNIDRNLNYDLTKPVLLAPILGPDGLGRTKKEWKNFSPAAGLAWSPSANGQTVVRAGAGIFYDFLFSSSLETERAALGPPGLGRRAVSGSSIASTLPGILGVPVGRLLDFRSPTLFTGADLMTILPSIRADQERRLASADPSVQTIQITKQLSGPLDGLSPTDSPSPSALHANLGLQRQIAAGLVLSADLVYRHFIHLGGGVGRFDLNRYFSTHPLIPHCSETQRDDPHAICSNGPINVKQAPGRATYKGLLLRADKRFSRGFQALGSYAYSSNTGTHALNLDNWLENRGPLNTDYAHIVNLAAVAQLPWQFELGLNFSYSSSPPLSAVVGGAAGGMDFNGDGTSGDLLPGTTVNGFNRGLTRADLTRLVEQFNQTHAGGRDTQGRTIPRLTLPVRYWFGDSFHTLDLRLTRWFVWGERYRVAVIGEVFNVYNAANLSGFSGNLASAAFGQPTSRLTQIFGSGGPRAFQLALRMSF